MNPTRIRQSLPIAGIGDPLYFFSTIGSTSDYASELAEQGAPHGTLVVADEQTAGRGRSGKSWSTPAGSALALSVLLRELPAGAAELAGLNLLGALAVARALSQFRHKVEIKWPNDVLLEGRKVSGVLVEPLWLGGELEAVVIGIGVNVTRAAVPSADKLDFPAISIEEALQRGVDREQVLLEIVAALAGALEMHDLAELPTLCEPYLAYRGESVELELEDERCRARVLGLRSDGRLVVETDEGERLSLTLEKAYVRPIDSRAN